MKKSLLRSLEQKRTVAAMLNQIVIMGRLIKDPELRYTPQSNAVVSFTLANDRDYKSSDGNRATDFIDCIAWRGTAEYVAKHFTKGRMALVKGRLESRRWRDKEGNNRISWEVIAEGVYFCDSKKDNGDTTAANTPVARGVVATSGPMAGFTEIDDDQLPF